MADKNFVEKYLMLIIISLVVAVGIVFIISNPFSPKGGIQNYAYQDIELCKRFSSPGEIISCAQAVNYTLKGYPGKVTFVDKTSLKIPIIVNGTQTGTTEKAGWLVRIELTDPIVDSEGKTIKAVEIFIDDEGKMMLYRLWD